MLKTIGVLGGISAQATMDFERRLHAAAQRLIPQRANSGYPPLLVYYHRRAPFVVGSDNMPVFPLQLDPDFRQAAQWLGARADFLVVTANGPHVLQSEIQAAAGCKLLSMIETTLAEVRRRGWSRTGVLGFGDPRVMVYTGPLSQMGLAYEITGDEMQGRINAAVLGVMEGRFSPESRQAVQEAVADLRARGVDGVILGCTELPLLYWEEAEEARLIDPVELLAEAAVKYALE